MTAQIIDFLDRKKKRKTATPKKVKETIFPAPTEDILTSASTFWICADYLRYKFLEGSEKYGESLAKWMAFCDPSPEDTSIEVPESYLDTIMDDGGGLIVILSYINEQFGSEYEG